MNCIETKRNIEALLDGELDDAQENAVEHHLWICPACLELKEQMASLANLLRTNRIVSPSAELDERVIKSFENHHSPLPAWRRLILGAVAVPKPIFAALLITAVAASWLAFQIGKISSPTISMTSPSVDTNEIPVQTPAETKIQTVFVEVPVIKEKIVTRTVYVRERKNNLNNKNEKNKSADSQPNDLLQYSSTVSDNGYFSDVNLKGFQPSAEINAKIIKEVKENEK